MTLRAGRGIGASILTDASGWPEVVASAAELRAPHRIISWTHELAADFHAFHHDLFVLHEDVDTRAFRLSAVRATREALERALGLLGVSAPDRM